MRTFQFIPPPLVVWFDPVWPSLLGRLVPVLSVTCARLRAWCHTGSYSARESSQSNHAHCTVSRYIAYSHGKEEQAKMVCCIKTRLANCCLNN